MVPWRCLSCYVAAQLSRQPLALSCFWKDLSTMLAALVTAHLCLQWPASLANARLGCIVLQVGVRCLIALLPHAWQYSCTCSSWRLNASCLLDACSLMKAGVGHHPSGNNARFLAAAALRRSFFRFLLKVTRDRKLVCLSILVCFASLRLCLCYCRAVFPCASVASLPGLLQRCL